MSNYGNCLPSVVLTCLGALAPACRPAAVPEPARAPAAAPAVATEKTVLFVCEHGAAKSVMAAAYFNREAAARGLAMKAIARGAEPQAEPSKSTVAGLRADGLEPLPAAPLPLADGDMKTASRVVLFDCTSPGMKRVSGLGECWDDVPTVSEGYAAARDRIQARVVTLLPPR